MVTVESLLVAMAANGHVVFSDSRGYDLNLFGVRTENNDANAFNDLVGVLYLQNRQWNLFTFPATTDPGVYWRRNPMNVDGTAILKPGQYRGSHQLGKHRGQYDALVQVAPVTVYRDGDRDDALDTIGGTQTGLFGINIHRASSVDPSTQVGKWSAGCQVLADPRHYDFLMAMAHKAASIYGDRFSYTLLTESDFQLSE